LITIVPSNSPLIAEIMINSSDVGHTKPGDAVVIKIDAYPYQRYGLLHGKLMSVSEESFGMGGENGGQTVLPQPSRNGSGAFHRGRIELPTTTLAQGAQPIPGMTLTAEVKVGTRSIMGYFLTPVTRGFTESLREP
jgi:HlyD family secretion protein